MMRLEPELLVKVQKLDVYKCEKCPKVFLKPKDLIKHKAFHNKVLLAHTLSAYVAVERAKIFKCDRCTISFYTRRELMLHKLDHIQENVRHERKAKRLNIKKDIVKPYKCPDCNYRFVAVSTLEEHSILHKPFPHVCECGIGYYKQHDLKTHMRLVHGTELKPTFTAPSRERDNNIVSEHKTATKGPSLKAVLVKKKPAKKKWKVKVKDQDGKNNVKHKSRGTILNPNIDIRQTSDDKFECPQCKKLFSSKNNVYIHYRIHSGYRPYTCEQCGKSFTQDNTYKNHIAAHLNERKFVCHYCDKAFNTPLHRKRHENIHSADKKHECPFCGKGFHDPSALLRHKRTHTGDKRYRCPYCPKAFTDISGLKAHKLRDEKNRKFQCELCPKKFYNGHDLRNHIAVHRQEQNYGCDYCKKFYACKGTLTTHMKSHLELKCYKCDQCPRTFEVWKHLKQHIKVVHKKGKIKSKSNETFECDDCSQQFFHKSNLIRHYRHRHGGICCKICSQYFSSKTDLRKHTLDKSELCEICDREFFCANLKDKHILKVHIKSFEIHKNEE